MRYEIGIAGSGEQEVVLMGDILAQAAASVNGLFLSQTRRYDITGGGGKAESNLVISDDSIDYPGITGLDLLLTLSQEGYERNIGKLKREGLLVVDPQLVKKIVYSKILRIPFTKIARERFNGSMVIHMIAIGALTELCQCIPPTAARGAISANYKGEACQLNLASFQEGMAYAANSRRMGFERVEEGQEMEI